MSGFAATSRSAACWRTSVQLRPGRGAARACRAWPPAAGAAATTVGAGAGAAARRESPPSPGPRSGAGPEQAATPIASHVPAPRARLRFGRSSSIESMEGTIDLLGEFVRDAFDCRQVLDARAGDPARTAEALQQPRPLLR